MCGKKKPIALIHVREKKLIALIHVREKDIYRLLVKSKQCGNLALTACQRRDGSSSADADSDADADAHAHADSGLCRRLRHSA